MRGAVCPASWTLAIRNSLTWGISVRALPLDSMEVQIFRHRGFELHKCRVKFVEQHAVHPVISRQVEFRASRFEVLAVLFEADHCSRAFV